MEAEDLRVFEESSMAMSNWDTLALNERGEPIAGEFTSKLGVRVEVYKNWIYVQDEKAWDEASGWARPTIMQVTHGAVHYKDVQILALRGPQEGVYAFAWSGWGSDMIGMIGIGVYGYAGDEFVGVLPESLDWLRERIKKDDLDIPEKLEEVDLGRGQRFNQGDGYFAEHLDRSVQATPAGEAEPPLMSRLTKGMGSEVEEDNGLSVEVVHLHGGSIIDALAGIIEGKTPSREP